MQGSYLTTKLENPVVSLVNAGAGREYLVVQFGSESQETVVLARLRRPDCWISRREIRGSEPMTAELAVSGLLLTTVPLRDPIDQLRFDLDCQRKRNSILRKEISRLMAREAGPARKRGVRGRRDP